MDVKKQRKEKRRSNRKKNQKEESGKYLKSYKIFIKKISFFYFYQKEINFAFVRKYLC